MLIDTILQVLNPKILLLVSLGSLSGVIIGALPGLSVTMAVSLLVSITFGWPMEHAMAMIIGVYCGGVYGGSISAVLLNIPGAPGAVCTVFDGYPLARRGEAAMALGLARIGSFFGGLIGVFFLAVLAPLIAQVALAFGPFEYLALVILGLVTIGSLSQGSFAKALISGIFGFLISCVGMDPIHGIGRFTFGSINLLAGINYISCLIGFFGISEVISQLQRGASKKQDMITQMGSVIPKLSTFKRMIPLILRSSVIGTWIGALPGVGGSIAAFIAYDSAKKTVKNPTRPFGEGAYEGVIAPEVANNAGIGGALIPLLTLGIPGDAVTAVMIGAFMVHGLRPGPLLMTQSADLFWLIIALSVVANVIFLFIGLATTHYAPKLLSVKNEYLMPIVAILCVVGSYAINNSVFDVIVMMLTGVVGYFMKKTGFPIGPTIIGIVLGPMADSGMRRATMISNGDVLGTFAGRPIAIIITVFAILQILDQFPRIKNAKKQLIANIFQSKRS